MSHLCRFFVPSLFRGDLDGLALDPPEFIIGQLADLLPSLIHDECDD